MTRRSYDQSCPIAEALDLLGERWTLLILRELLGGARRYSDLREALPGIATNLLAGRLRQLVADGLAEQVDVPPPVARTWYQLTDQGWRRVVPVLQALALFGMNRLEPSEQATPLSGFLAVLLGFDERLARPADEDYRVVVDGREFDIGVRHGRLTAARGDPAAELRGSARALLEHRWALLGEVSDSPASGFQIEGAAAASARFVAIFRLDAQTAPPAYARRPEGRRRSSGPLPAGAVVTEERPG